MEAVEGVDDRDGHILAGRIMSPRSTDDVAARIVAFVRENLAATPSS